MGYFGPETMFLLSLPSDGRDTLYDLVEEALQLRMSGLSTAEIEERLERDIAYVESVSSTPRMVRRIVLGDISIPDLDND